MKAYDLVFVILFSKETTISFILYCTKYDKISTRMDEVDNFHDEAVRLKNDH